ncbi:hypothetical protein ACWX0K_11880 [Nitrobacteraceae bacterium UC4446_H13]
MSSHIDASRTSSLEPVPRQNPLPYEPIDWPVVRRIGIPPAIEASTSDFMDVVNSRSSLREFERAPLREIVNFLNCATQVQSTWINGPTRSKRPAHSAGGLHSTEIFLLTGFGNLRVFRMVPLAQEMHQIEIQHRSEVMQILVRVTEMAPRAGGDLIVLLSDLGLLNSCYENAMPLAWRDAGALMQMLHLFAAMHRLAFCPLGISGTELVNGIAPLNASVHAMGVAVVGRSYD